MSDGNPLKKLVRVSLARNTNKKLFLSLLEQLLLRESVSDSQLAEFLLEIPENGTKTLGMTGRSTERTKIEYAVEFAFSNSENLTRFFKLLPQLSHQCQGKYMILLKGRIAQIIGRPIIEDLFEKLSQYTIDIDAEIIGSSLEKTPGLKRLWYGIVFLWGALIDTNPFLTSNAKFKDMLLGISQVARGSGDANISSFISRKILTSTDSTVLSQFQAQNIAKAESTLTGKSSKTTSLNLTSKKYSSYVALKKFIWLNTHFRAWKINDDLTRGFISFFDLQGLSHENLAKELIRSFFNGFALGVKLKEEPYVTFNWKNFILTQLVYDLKNIVSHPYHGEDDYGSLLTSLVVSFGDSVIIKSKVGGTNDTYDLGKEFLRACVYHEVISLDHFIKTYSSEAENVSALLIAHEVEKLGQTDLLTADFSSKLENVNTEFTSFEESKLIEYFRNLLNSNFRFLKAKQQKLADLMEGLIGNLIREKNNEKLSWVALIFLNVPAIANYIFYRSKNGPWMFLNQAINYIDTEPFNVDEDDGNFQDLYAHFGVILTGVISVSTLFGVDFASFSIKSSYTIDFINEFYFRLCDTLTNSYTGINEQETQIITNYENLFKEWANALFDVNNDGLSDDLLKSVNVKQIYKFIFFLFREAFTARVLGNLSENSLNNGIDYLSQNFLAPCSLEAMLWIASRIGPQQKSNDTMVEIMLRIIEGNIGDTTSSDSNSQKFTFRMILNTIGPNLIRRLKTFSGNQMTGNLAKLKDIILKETDPEYSQWCKSTNQSTVIVNIESISTEIINYLKETATMGIDEISERWRRIELKWNCSPKSATCYTLLKEIDNSSSMRAPLALEESKIVVDFLVFLLTCSSYMGTDDLNSYVSRLEPGTLLSLLTQSSENNFKVTINDHYSSIFNEDFGAEDVSPKEDKLQPREDLMGDFEMGDLFDDMSDNFFDELMALFGKQNNPVVESTNTKISFDAETLYKQLNRRVSPIWEISFLLASPEYENSGRLTGLARRKLRDELEKWKVAHRL